MFLVKGCLIYFANLRRVTPSMPLTSLDLDLCWGGHSWSLKYMAHTMPLASPSQKTYIGKADIKNTWILNLTSPALTSWPLHLSRISNKSHMCANSKEINFTSQLLCIWVRIECLILPFLFCSGRLADSLKLHSKFTRQVCTGLLEHLKLKDLL